MKIKIIYFDFKNLKGYYMIPLLVLYIFIPILNVGMVNMSGSVGNAYSLVFRETEKYLPIMSVWWTIFIFREYIEGDGNEILYCIGQMGKIKAPKIIFIFIWYIIHVGILFLVYSIFWDNILLEYIKTVIQCFFFSSVMYMLIYTLKSTTISFMILLIYELFAIFINTDIVNYISIYENGNKITPYIISAKYMPILILSIGFFIIGIYKNKAFYH